MCAALLLMVGCRGPEPADEVVARVGSSVITAGDFIRSYELGYPQLRTGPDPRRTYLDRMIDERLLAQEARRRGLNQAARVARRVESLLEELLVEQVFEHEVNAGLTVTDSEIDSLRFADQVSFRIRYLPASRREEAERLRGVLVQDGFEAAVAAMGGEIPVTASQLESPYLKAGALQPDFLRAISGLTVGVPSEPIALGGSFLVVQVMDIQRTAVSETPGADERQRYEQILRQQKAKQAARRFIAETVGISGLRIKAGPYRDLEGALWEWLQSSPPDEEGRLSERLRQDSSQSARRMRDLEQDLLMQTDQESWTVGRFLEEYPVERYPLNHADRAVFRQDLHDAFGLVLRDRDFVRRGLAAGYDRLPEVQEELARWEDKWVYRALAHSIQDSLSSSQAEREAYFARHREFWPEDVGLAQVVDDVDRRVRNARAREALAALVSRLRSETPPHVNQQVLDHLPLSDPASAPLTLFKGHTGRPAYPVVDYGL